ncbi:MAG: SRPBCC family protein [Actinomycetota bacterium]|nr:SRPBCC family protein [Actinomycetota bacterium]
MAITKHVYQTYIKATPEQVWEAIVEPSWTRRYFHSTAFDSPPTKGEPYRTTMADGRPAVDGVIEEVDPPNRLVMTWHVLYDAAMSEEPPSRVEWIVEPVGEGLTRLRLEHGDLARSPLTWANVKDGWVYVLDGLKTVIETGESLPPMTSELTPIEDAAGEWHRAQGIECNNSTWEMIEAERTRENDEEMLRRAYASTYHWARAARRTPANDARGAWLLAKVQLLAGQPELSLRYADACMLLCREHGLDDFDLAYAHEARARALKGLGDEAAAAESWEMAKSVPIADPEDQAILDGDLAVGP